MWDDVHNKSRDAQRGLCCLEICVHLHSSRTHSPAVTTNRSTEDPEAETDERTCQRSHNYTVSSRAALRAEPPAVGHRTHTGRCGTCLSLHIKASLQTAPDLYFANGPGMWAVPWGPRPVYCPELQDPLASGSVAPLAGAVGRGHPLCGPPKGQRGLPPPPTVAAGHGEQVAPDE